jgi:exonuclease III
MGKKNLKIATWNVRSLANKGDKGEELYLGKFYLLEKEFLVQGLDIVAMQETKVKDQLVVERAEYNLYLAGQDSSKLDGSGQEIPRQQGTGVLIRKVLDKLTIEFHRVNERLSWIGSTWFGKPSVIIIVYAPTLASSWEGTAETVAFYECV